MSTTGLSGHSGRVRLRREQLHGRLERVERLVTANLELLLAGDFDDRVAKAACEVALLATHIATRDIGARHRAWAESTLAALLPRLAGEEVVQRLLWNPSRAGMFALGLGLLRRAGWRDPARRNLAASVLQPRFAASYEASSYQALEQNWCAQLLDLAPPIPHAGPLPFERAGNPLFMLAADAYAYTHAVLYATDFGAQPLTPESASRAAGAIEAGVCWSLARRDFDLLGEWLLCAVAVQEAPTPAVVFGLHVLAAAWDDCGVLPDGALSPSPKPGREELFFGVYHASIVGGLLMSALLARPGWSEAHAPEPPCDSPELAGRCVTVLADLLGARIASTVQREVPRSTWADVLSDLLIHVGMHRRDLLLVLDGLDQRVADRQTASWSGALHWLEAFHRGASELGLLDRAEGRATRAALESALLRARQRADGGGAHRSRTRVALGGSSA